jgi:hypothetical protein
MLIFSRVQEDKRRRMQTVRSAQEATLEYWALQNRDMAGMSTDITSMSRDVANDKRDNEMDMKSVQSKRTGSWSRYNEIKHGGCKLITGWRLSNTSAGWSTSYFQSVCAIINQSQLITQVIDFAEVKHSKDESL